MIRADTTTYPPQHTMPPCCNPMAPMCWPRGRYANGKLPDQRQLLLERALFFLPQLLWQVTAANGLYVAVGDDATIMTSNDGANWSVEEVPEGDSISYDSTAFLGVGGTTTCCWPSAPAAAWPPAPTPWLPW